MRLSPGGRKAALTVHVVSTVGWLGAVLAFLSMAVIGWATPDEATARAAYLVMEPAARLVLVPLALLSLGTGILQSLGTRWGLIRHYWVLYKLGLTVVATAVLLVYMETFARMATAAADPDLPLAMVRDLSPVLHAGLALAVLLAATVLGIYKPRGLTRFGWRKEREEGRRPG